MLVARHRNRDRMLQLDDRIPADAPATEQFDPGHTATFTDGEIRFPSVRGQNKEERGQSRYHVTHGHHATPASQARGRGVV